MISLLTTDQGSFVGSLLETLLLLAAVYIGFCLWPALDATVNVDVDDGPKKIPFTAAAELEPPSLVAELLEHHGVLGACPGLWTQDGACCTCPDDQSTDLSSDAQLADVEELADSLDDQIEDDFAETAQASPRAIFEHYGLFGGCVERLEGTRRATPQALLEHYGLFS